MNKKMYLLTVMLLLSTPVLAAEDQPAAAADVETKVTPAVVEADAATEAGTGAQAQEESDLDSDYTFGTVSKISKEEITIKEFDDQSGQEVENTYKIAADAEWENVQSFQDVKAGDYAEIDYTAQNDGKVASFISIESMTDEGNTEESKEKLVSPGT